MGIKLRASVEGDRVREKLDQWGPRIREALERRMTRLLIRMQGHVKRNKLSGQVLHRRTGNLSRSIHYALDPRQEGAVSGRLFVGPNAPYGAIHEYGGTVTVREHLRMQRVVDPVTDEVDVFPVTVRAHTVTYPVRSFMRSTLRDFRDEFRKMVEAAVRDAGKPPSTGGAAAAPAAD